MSYPEIDPYTPYLTPQEKKRIVDAGGCPGEIMALKDELQAILSSKARAERENAHRRNDEALGKKIGMDALARGWTAKTIENGLRVNYLGEIGTSRCRSIYTTAILVMRGL